jgi:hypothetical protein
MIVLADDADNDGVSVISAQTLANRIRTKPHKETGIRNTRTVYRLIDAAEIAGEIYVQKAPGIENAYLVCLNRPAEEIVEVLTRRLNLDSHTAGMVAQERVAAQKRTRDKMSLVPVTECHGSSDKMSLVTSDKMSPVRRGNGSLPIKDQIINIRETQEYKDMETAVAIVCRFLDVVAIEEPDQERIEVLVRNGVSAAEVQQHYGSEAGSWWRSYWKGKKGQRPTTKDIVETIVQAREGADFADAEAEFTAAWKSLLDYLKGKMEWEDVPPRVQAMIRHFKESTLRKASKNQMAKYRGQALDVWSKSPEKVDRT